MLQVKNKNRFQDVARHIFTSHRLSSHIFFYMLRFSVVAAVSGGMFLCTGPCLYLMKKVQYCADSQCRMYIYSTQKNSLVVYQLEQWLIEGWTCIKFYLYCFKKWHWILVNYVFFGWGGINLWYEKQKDILDRHGSPDQTRRRV